MSTRHGFVPTVLAAAVVMGGVALAGAQAPQENPRQAALQQAAHVSPQVRAMLARISPQRIEDDVRTLTGFYNRNTLSSQHNPNRGIGAARDWIYQQFQDAASQSDGRMTVTLQSYIQKAVPGELPRPVRITNVFATLHGSQPASADRIYVVSGHYDSRCSNVFDTKCFAPGSDDDATGVAVSLELARAMAPMHLDATIIFMAVAGEEQGLFGSTHFVKVAKRQGLDIEGMLDNDIVGNADGTPNTVRLFSEGVPTDETKDERSLREEVGGENDSPARELARYVKEVADNDATRMNVALIFRRDRYLRGGDQIPFLENGYRSAVRFTEYKENFRHEHQNVRQEGGIQYGDLPRFVEFDYAAGVAKVNGAALAALADSPASPKGAQIVATQLTNTTTLRWQPNTEPDLAGYEVVWRNTIAPLWQHTKFVGNVTQVTLNMSKDNLFFGVRAVDDEGNASPVTFPTPFF